MTTVSIAWNRPNFLVIGAAKCASTSMCALLGEHPDIFMCDPKEPRFFSRNENYKRGWDWYGPHFASAQGKKRIGEGSVCYGNPLRHKDLVERIVRDLGEIKFIYMVRHPLQRIESDWKMRRHLRDSESCETLSETIRKFPNILEHSMYWQQLQCFFQRYRPEQFMISFFEDFVKHPEIELKRALVHLDVAPVIPAHAAPEKPRNSSQEYQAESMWMSFARSVPGFAVLKQLIPSSSLSLLRQRFTKTVEYVPHWEPQVRAETVAKLRDDAAHVLAFAGKPANYWNLN
jgi:Sulfotransferase domain